MHSDVRDFKINSLCRKLLLFCKEWGNFLEGTALWPLYVIDSKEQDMVLPASRQKQSISWERLQHLFIQDFQAASKRKNKDLNITNHII